MRWIAHPALEAPSELLSAVGGHPLVAATLARRGYTDPQRAQAFLSPELYQPASPFELPGMERAVERLAQAIHHKERVLVWGDFDVDGQTATALLVSMLQALGLQPSFHIPIRARESHGIGLPVLRELFAQGVDLVLTCDTGIAAHEALAYAAGQGVDVIVTDHHELPLELPPALALINPRLLPTPDHPLAALPGVGVAFQLARALFAHLGRHGEENASLDLVALGVVADVAQLVGDTRYWLQLGLQALRQTTRLGLLSLFENTRLAPALIQEDDIGFLIGPRLNALGRLGDANLAVEFLTTHDLSRARILAQTLEGLNEQRKLLSQAVLAGAQAQLQADPALLKSPVLVLAHPTWPAGVIGPVASRLVEHYSRPVVLLSMPPGEPARASARSIPGVNITAALAASAELLLGFGGHPLAAGFSILPERIPELRRALALQVERAGIPPEPELALDGELGLGELSLELAADLERLAPFGAGNPSLTLVCRNLHLLSSASLGREEEHLVLVVEDEASISQRVLWWGGAAWPLPVSKFDLAFRLRVGAFKGKRQLQLEWIDACPVTEGAALPGPLHPVRQGRDFRRAASTLPLLRALLAEDLVQQVWAEGETLQALQQHGLAAVARDTMTPAPRLVIWSIPPGPAEMAQALQASAAQEVVFFAVDPHADQPEVFLRRLVGLLRYALRQSTSRAPAEPWAEVTLELLAAATAQRTQAVLFGLECLAAAGHLTFRIDDHQVVQLQAGGVQDLQAGLLAQARLSALLGETAAFRAYYARAPLEALLSIT